MAIRKIMCACGSGLGSSLIVHSEIEVDHTTISDINPNAADLFVVGGDLKDFVSDIPDEKKIILNNILDKNELEEKLAERLK